MAFTKSFLKPPLTFPSVSGDVCSFVDKLGGFPLKAHDVSLVAKQAAGTPSPSNPLPISGWDAIHIGNISDNTNISYFKGVLNGTYGFVDLGMLNYTYTSGDPTPHFTSTTSPSGIKLPATYGTKISLLCPNYNNTKAWSQAFGVAGNDKYIAISASGGLVGISDSDYTNPTTFKEAMSGVYLIYELATPTTPSFTNAEFEALCEAFGMNGQSFTIQIGSTVYGGTYDAITGILTVTHFGFVGNAGLIVSKISAVDNLSTYMIRTSTNNFPNAVNLTVISSHFSTDIASGSGRMAQATNDIYLVIDNTLLSEDTTTGFVTWLTNNAVTFVYELATPTTIQLSPAQILTLKNSNIWADTGATSLQYIKIGR